MEELSFANGIALSKEEDFLLVNECGASRIWRYWLKGEKNFPWANIALYTTSFFLFSKAREEIIFAPLI